ncbi:hypothetical protein ANPL_02175 [Anaplasma platys]|uniref:Uncharacterized protein n=1 Tax=Anaplasma platys TaxID=949 RepID=A0A858PY27_9RICK|nr:hypothetical protein ANPL_02175 [Anaplasma platys]
MIATVFFDSRELVFDACTRGLLCVGRVFFAIVALVYVMVKELRLSWRQKRLLHQTSASDDSGAMLRCTTFPFNRPTSFTTRFQPGGHGLKT